MAERRARKSDRMAEIEAAVQRPVTVETLASEVNLSKCNPQTQSPLFQIPAELRDIIFEYATLPMDDTLHPYASTEFYYRPGCTARQYASTGLVRTCRLAWLEANHLPFQQTGHYFWLRGAGRRPKHLNEMDPQETVGDDEPRMERFIHYLTIKNRQNLKAMHLFTQVYWLQDRMKPFLPRLLGSSGACPEVLTITISHTDWFYWERTPPAPLRLNSEPIGDLLRWPALPRLCEIRLELETLESQMDQLRSIVYGLESAFSEMRRVDHFGNPVVVRLQQSPPEWTWSGPTNPGGKKRPHYAGLATLDYRVVTLVWKIAPDVANGESVQRTTQSDDEYASLTHSLGPKLPMLSVDYPQKAGSTLSGLPVVRGDPIMRNEERLQAELSEPSAREWMKKWEKQRSLLKFAPIPDSAT